MAGSLGVMDNCCQEACKRIAQTIAAIYILNKAAHNRIDFMQIFGWLNGKTLLDSPTSAFHS